jgi:hypothetical protein
MDSDPLKVRLGGRDYDLEPQKSGRIFRKLSAIASAFGGEETPSSITGVVHDAFKVFIPKIGPEWELAGYPSEDAYQAKLDHDQELTEGRNAYAAEMLDLEEATWADLTPAQRKGFEGPAFEDPYDEDRDASPTFPEIADAIEAIYQVNGGKRLERLLKGLVDQQMIRAMLRNGLMRLLTSTSSPSSPRTNGASDPTSSGTTIPIPPPQMEVPPSPEVSP